MLELKTRPLESDNLSYSEVPFLSLISVDAAETPIKYFKTSHQITHLVTIELSILVGFQFFGVLPQNWERKTYSKSRDLY